MATVIVNGEPTDIGNEKLNVIQAAQKAGVLVPHYCWHPSLSVVASCRMCLVEVGEMKDGKPLMQPKVVPGCQTPVKDGMVIVTNSPKAKQAQADTLEGLLLNHPLDCPVCDKAGECKLQDYSYQFGRAQTRMVDEKNTPPNKPHLSEKITLFTDRCIMCTRCVRFTREISGTAELQVINRGNHAEIDIFPDEPLNNKLAGNVVDLCPVGALGSKDFLYTQRVWYLKTEDNVCTGCSTGCSIHVDTNKDIVFRLRPRVNPQAQGHFMCDEGRYGYHYVNNEKRIVRPYARRDGKLIPAAWSELLPAMRREFANLAASSPSKIVVILSPFQTVESAFLIGKYFSKLSSKIRFAMGPVPIVGEDDRYPKDRRGNPIEPTKFVIRAEKCPNRLGVEAILKHFQTDYLNFEQVLTSMDQGQFEAAYFAGGYPDPSVLQGAEAFRKVGLVVVQDFFDSPISKAAKYVLPATSFAEKEGTYLNHARLAQCGKRAVRPPQECRTEGQVALDLMERPGLLRASAVRAELAQEVGFFKDLPTNMPELGFQL